MAPDPAVDRRFMRSALALAARGLGRTWPNPAVGCVIVAAAADGAMRPIGRGWTQPGGRPHAETEALGRARALAGAAGLAGATAYVTLEPCSHHGRTPPCADALIEAGIRRVVVACGDPDRRVAGAGVARLRAAGLIVDEGLCESEARALNGGFLLTRSSGRPLVTLKLAASLDGRIATASGKSQWITGERARARAHLMRARHDAVMVGGGTALADDPQLDCRLPGMADRPPVAVVVDGRLAALSPASRLAAAARQRKVWVLTTPHAAADRADALVATGIEVIRCTPDGERHVAMAGALEALAGRGVTRVLVEGGAGMAAALLREGLVDRLAWFRAPTLLGGDGLAAIEGLGVDSPGEAPRFVLSDREMVGDDLLETFERVA
ncbi:MAG: bifunctional diaminohydroxyphosphoribosylaminopyrimidine deaminase/5-amino-6-(5-phosphoribosylamino)uracil reductase RibD [Alphaproteobacteria bacterium]